MNSLSKKGMESHTSGERDRTVTWDWLSRNWCNVSVEDRVRFIKLLRRKDDKLWNG